MTIIFSTKSTNISSKCIRTNLFNETSWILRFRSLFNNFFPHFHINYTHLNRSISTGSLLIFDRFNCLNKAVSNDKFNIYRNFSNFLSKCSTKGHTSALNYNLFNGPSGPANSNINTEHRHFSTRNISGRLFYRRRPKMVPRYKPKKRRSCWLEGAPQKKGIVITVRVTTPRKPNSGLRKIARVRLTTGRTVTCHIPGQGHNLHTHSVVLVRGGRCQDVSGCHYTLVRGKYDLLPVKNRSSSRSKYGIKMTDEMKSKLSIKKKDFHITTNLDREIFNKIQSKNWVNLDGSVYEDTVQEHEDIPFDIFRFNTRWRRIINSNKQA